MKMSDNVASAGIMAPLNRKLTDEEREEWQELLWDQGSDVHINYDGTLAYTDEGGNEYGISFGNMASHSMESFKDLEQFGVGVVTEKARPYTCYWYNGSDSDMDMMTLEKFLKHTGQ
jgi:hypothetical protein